MRITVSELSGFPGWDFLLILLSSQAAIFAVFYWLVSLSPRTWKMLIHLYFVLMMTALPGVLYRLIFLA